MPDPTAKVTFFFQDDTQSLGWSEVHYAVGASQQAIQQAALSVAETRVQLLCGPIQLKYIRVTQNIPPSTVGVRRQRLASLTAPLLVGSYTPGSDYPDVAWTAAKIRLSNADGTIFRVQLLRGSTDAQWDLGSDKKFKVFMTGWCKNYLAALNAANFQGHHIVRGNPAGSYYAYGQCFYEGLTRRATGRPSYLPRGRK